MLTRADTHQGKILDHDYQVTARKLGITINKLSGDELSRFPFERARVRSVWYFLIGGICTTIAVGWTIEKEVHLAVTIVLTFIWGVTYTGLFTVGVPCSSQHLRYHHFRAKLGRVFFSFSDNTLIYSAIDAADIDTFKYSDISDP